MIGTLSASSAAASLFVPVAPFQGETRVDTVRAVTGRSGEERGERGESRAEERREGEASVAPRAAGTTRSLTALRLDAVLALQQDTGEQTSETSPQATSQSAAGGEGEADPGKTRPVDAPANAGGQQAGASEASGEDEGDTSGDGLSQEEEKQVRELAARDREVRAHEQAHARVGGNYAGAPSYTYQQGPDGKRYAIGGEVAIDTSSERTPEATIRKMQIVIRAATAPAEPSSQDLKVAQQARAALSEAQAQARQEQAAELSGDDEDGEAAPSASASGGGEGATRSGDGERNGAEGARSDAGLREQAFAAYRGPSSSAETSTFGLVA
ncbi:putative metalloprotease CJM1_0395 family protein [Roseibium aestuarii]|uniref:Metalloprotease CJM1_0395 family protein n=1 Tax=Roseibium aestuarii TaxID=2600299 RepID=A0ABW4JZ85_9HYPH|nr:putative metalloprotease CJM1_0395 family protein [Roseibium aestuarii]